MKTARRPPSPQRSQKRVPKPDRRRALELLAASPDGLPEAIMLANGFTVAQLAELVRAGVALRHPSASSPATTPPRSRG